MKVTRNARRRYSIEDLAAGQLAYIIGLVGMGQLVRHPGGQTEREAGRPHGPRTTSAARFGGEGVRTGGSRPRGGAQPDAVAARAP
jgi:hypothetical protein